MAKHREAMIWALKKVGNYPQAYIETLDSKNIVVSYYHSNADSEGRAFIISRSDARLLARRINQCLDETK